MLEELEIPDDPRIAIMSVSDGDDRLNPCETGHINLHTALTVGYDSRGLIDWEHIEKLGELAAQMKWFLDSERWQWTRRPRQREALGEKLEATSSSGASFWLSFVLLQRI